MGGSLQAAVMSTPNSHEGRPGSRGDWAGWGERAAGSPACTGSCSAGVLVLANILHYGRPSLALPTPTWPWRTALLNDIPTSALLPPCCQQVREAEHNIRTFKRLWAKAARLAAAGLDSFAATHDAMGALEFLAADEQAAEDAAAAAAARAAVNATATA